MSTSPDFNDFVAASLVRYINNDWGDIDVSDIWLNDTALDPNKPNRILAVYDLPANILADPLVLNRDGGKDAAIWIITEWDRSVTTILWPSEY